MTVTVERLTLSKFGAPVAYLRSRNAEGGDWQAFMFSSELQTWVRLADLRHVMSRAFKVLPEFAVAAAASEREGAAGGGAGGLDVLQSEAAYSGGLTTRCVDHLCHLLIRSFLKSNHTTHTHTTPYLSHSDILAVATATHAASTVTGSGLSGASLAAREWTSVATLSHTEERLAVAALTGDTRETEHWLSQWVAFCTKSGLHHKVKWAANRLLENASRGEGKGHGARQESGLGGGWDFFETVDRPMRVLRDVILPAVGRCGAAVGSLLGDIEDAIEMTSL